MWAATRDFTSPQAPHDATGLRERVLDAAQVVKRVRCDDPTLRCTLGEAVSPTSERSSLDDVIDAYKPGIDVTLIDENLRRSVDERLRNLQRMLEFAEELRRAGRALATRT